jgi:hypothetical protein
MVEMKYGGKFGKYAGNQVTGVIEMLSLHLDTQAGMITSCL